MGALNGLRVLEFVGLGPAPFAAMMLADHGAEVIRLHPLKAREKVALIDTPYDVLARGRPSVAVDLKNPEGIALVLDLLGQADALIEGFRPGVMERLGLGPKTVAERNPRLVYGRMTGWGQTGPLAHQAGHDIDYIAISGVLGAIGPAGGAPVPPLNLVGDFGGGGMLLAFGLLAALLSARETGSGQVVDAAMTDGSALLAAMIWGFRAGGGWSGERGENLLDGGAPWYATYACADGRHIAVGALEPQFRATFFAGIGIDPPPMAEQESRKSWPTLRAVIAARLASRSQAEWVAVFEGTDACVAPVLDWDEAATHPHNIARGTFGHHAGFPQPAPAPRLSKTPAAPPGTVHAPGADTVAVLTRWGVAGDRIAALRAAGAI